MKNIYALTCSLTSSSFCCASVLARMSISSAVLGFAEPHPTVCQRAGCRPVKGLHFCNKFRNALKPMLVDDAAASVSFRKPPAPAERERERER